MNLVRLAPGWIRVAAVVAWMGLIFWLSSQHTLPRPKGVGDIENVIGHFGAYGILAALVFWALTPHLRSSHLRSIVTILLVLAYGISDEFHQTLVPGRTPDIKDIMVDTLGGACMLALIHVVVRVQHSRAAS